jgi:1,2-phenylacetyl-CoA epoxidase catalytic subunit
MKKIDKLWKKVKKDFPKDPALQEIHYARLKIQEETKDMTPQEFVRYIKEKAKELLEKG